MTGECFHYPYSLVPSSDRFRTRIPCSLGSLLLINKKEVTKKKKERKKEREKDLLFLNNPQMIWGDLVSQGEVDVGVQGL
jgi:hypothetical protein